jgi:prepilin-type N-terminal cleavage/methylation domain-containing protein
MRQGVNLIEVLIVIAILGIILTIAVPLILVMNPTKGQADSTAKSAILQVAHAELEWKERHRSYTIDFRDLGGSMDQHLNWAPQADTHYRATFAPGEVAVILEPGSVEDFSKFPLRIKAIGGLHSYELDLQLSATEVAETNIEEHPLPKAK